VYAMSRVCSCVGLSRANAPTFFTLLIVFGVLSIVAGGYWRTRRGLQALLLAYSSISQNRVHPDRPRHRQLLGYVGALFHILAHALGKGLLLLTAGFI